MADNPPSQASMPDAPDAEKMDQVNPETLRDYQAVELTS
jgi:hypothetical protein